MIGSMCARRGRRSPGDGGSLALAGSDCWGCSPPRDSGKGLKGKTLPVGAPLRTDGLVSQGGE